MSRLTKRQKHNIVTTLLIGVVCVVLGCVCYAIAAVWPSPSQATVQAPPTPQVSASRFEQINTVNDGTFDHNCVGHEGMWIGPDTGDFSVVPNDPLCR